MFKPMEFPPAAATAKKPEKRGEAMDQMLGVIAERLNRDFAPFLDNQQKGPIVDETCSIDPDCFQVVNGGPYNRVDDIKTDRRFVRAKQLEWSEAEDANVAKFYAGKYGCKTTEDIVAQWVKNKEQHVSTQLEKAITAIFYKIIGSKFLVMRASTYDDYANRVDNVIVDRATGDVICTFDEVHDAGKGDRRAEKEEKIVKVARHGGCQVKYGVTFEEDSAGKQKLVKKGIGNIPLFYISLNTDELYDLLNGMSYDLDKKPTEVEIRTFNKLLDSLAEQQKFLSEQPRIDSEVAKNLKRFEESLARMREVLAGSK